MAEKDRLRGVTMSWVTPPSPASGGASSVTTSVQVLALATDATLTGERVFSPAEGLGATDGGAGGNYSLSMTSRVFNQSGVSIVTSTTITITMFNIVIPSNDLGTTKSLRVVCFGEANNLANAAAATWSIAFVLNATTLYADTIVQPAATTAARGPFFCDVYLTNENATNAQLFSGNAFVGQTLGATTGLGDLGGDELAGQGPLIGSAAVDSTATMSFACIISPGTAGLPSRSWIKRYHVARIL
jgi:hypothetical protein